MVRYIQWWHPIYEQAWSPISTIEAYNPITDKWTKKADMPTPRRGFSASVVNGKIYIIGGMSVPNVASATVLIYNLATGEWTEKSNISTARDILSTSVVNGKIYAIGGQTDAVNLVKTVEEYTPEGWQSVSPSGKLPTTWGQRKLDR